ncbi:uncharacterized protein LOC143251242 [Tachypleus tridentatus]|uniref:uncharacterized protein LOC143251242 n=1 Tax=Tachypleus tridentatus TaxID=6853 RepID=UPI003FCFA531
MVRRKPPVGIVILSCIIIWHLNGCDVECDQTALRESYPTKLQKEDETLVRNKIPDYRSNYYKKQPDDRSNSAGDKRIPNQLREYGYISSLGQRRQVRVPKLDENEGNQISHKSNKKPEQRYSEKRMLIYYGRIGSLGCRSKLLPNVGTSTCETGNSQNRRNTEKNNERKFLGSQRIISRRNSKHTAINDSEFSNSNQLYRKNMENKSNSIRSVQETRASGNRRAVNTVVENRRTQQQYNFESGNLENRRQLSEDLFLGGRRIMDRRNFNSEHWKETEMNDSQTQILYQDTSNENHDFQTETFKNLRRTKTSDSGRQTLNSIRSNDRRVSQTITSEDQRNNKLSISERHTEEHHRTLDRRGSETTNIRNMKTNKMHDSEGETSEITRSSNRRISHSRTMEYRRTNERRIMQRQTAERYRTLERRETKTRTLRNMRANNIHGSERQTLEFSRLNERRVFEIRSLADERKRDLNVPEREIKGHHRTFLRCEFQTRSSENLRTNKIYDSVGQITELSPSNDRRASRSRTMENRRSSERLIVDRQAGEYLKTLEERDYQKDNLEALKRNKIRVTERHNFDASRLNERRVLQIRTSKIQRRNVLGVSERETGERRQPLERFEPETGTLGSIRRNKRNGSEKQVLGYSRTNERRVSQVSGGENRRIKKMHDSLQHASELQTRIKIRNTQTRSLEIHRINEGHNSILKTFKYVISNIRRNLHRRFLLNKQKVILRDNSKTRDLKNVKNTNSETSKNRRSDRSNSQYRTLQPFTRTSGRYSETISLNEGGYYKLLRYERLNAQRIEYEIMVLEQHQLSQRRYLKQQRRELKRSSQNKPEVRQRSLKYYKIRSLKITRKADRGMYETKTLKKI